MTYTAPVTGTPDPQVLTNMGNALAATAWANQAVSATGTLSTASRALFCPVYLSQPHTYVKAFWINGGAVAGNVDVGIYTLSGTTLTRVVASTAEAQATISVMQVAGTFASTTIGPGLYYLAISASSTSANFVKLTPAAAAYGSNGVGILQAASSHPLPSSVTAAIITNTSVPIFGVSELSTI